MSDYSHSRDIDQSYATLIDFEEDNNRPNSSYMQIARNFRNGGSKIEFQKQKEEMKSEMPFDSSFDYELKEHAEIKIISQKPAITFAKDTVVIRPTHENIIDCIKNRIPLESIPKHFTIAFVASGFRYHEYRGDKTSLVITPDNSRITVFNQYGTPCEETELLLASVQTYGKVLNVPVQLIIKQRNEMINAWNHVYEKWSKQNYD